ncbi:MAG: nitric oxide synthase oxygenase [Shimia sp.]
MRRTLAPERDVAHLCGPQGFLDTMVGALDAADWPTARRRVASFVYAPGQGAGAATAQAERIDIFDIETEAVRADSFHLRPAATAPARRREAETFLRQFYHEVGAATPFATRMEAVARSLAATGTYTHTGEELAYGARLAWRNSTRCIGRFFWQTLTVRDRRTTGAGLTGAALARAIFDECMEHMRFGTNGGDLRPAITVFSPEGPDVFIENGQLILYAGHRQTDGTILGDPKNADLTDTARALGWEGAGTPFDLLPLMIRVDGTTHMFDLPREDVLEVALEHPEAPAFAGLGLRWFAMPAVANMAMDMGGVVYRAAPSNGFYMGTEIGSFNLADPRRYDRMEAVAEALGYDTGPGNPLWRDQAMLELNRAVLHSFRASGVRILDHHDLSRWFDRFRADEGGKGRPVFGHWPWIVPPMSANLSSVWHDPRIRNVILKPGYFYNKG